MKVCLIFTKNELSVNYDQMSFRDDHVGFIPPLNHCTVASIMENEGVEVEILDMDVENLNYHQALERISKFSPDLLGFSISTSNFRVLLSWIRAFKNETQIPIIVGGPHLALYPKETMSHQDIDYAIIGEAEIPLPKFLKAFQNRTSFSGIKSLAYRKNGELFIDDTRQTLDDIDALPLPSRHLINNSLYSNILSRKKNFTATY